MGQKGDNNMNPEDGFVGVDVSKAYLDIAVRPTGDGWRVTNDDSGVAQAVDQLAGLLQPSCTALPVNFAKMSNLSVAAFPRFSWRP